ncbi:MAG: hypothetical protein GY788_10095 [bacterium]|nr:hypothetical protein [bacterium]
MTFEVITLALLLAVVAGSCSSRAGDNAAWCSGFADFSLAGAALDVDANGSPEQVAEAAAGDMDAAFVRVAEATVPGEIEAEFDQLKKGPDVADGGDAFSAVAERVSDWALANCGYAPELIEMLDSEVPRAANSKD